MLNPPVQLRHGHDRHGEFHGELLQFGGGFEAVCRDRDRLEQQLSLYSPDYVIMCGSRVADLLVGAESKSKGIYAHDEEAWLCTARGIWYREIDATPFIWYWHPQAHVPAKLLHYGLIDAVRELADRRR